MSIKSFDEPDHVDIQSMLILSRSSFQTMDRKKILWNNWLKRIKRLENVSLSIVFFCESVSDGDESVSLVRQEMSAKNDRKAENLNVLTIVRSTDKSSFFVRDFYRKRRKRHSSKRWSKLNFLLTLLNFSENEENSLNLHRNRSILFSFQKQRIPFGFRWNSNQDFIFISNWMPFFIICSNLFESFPEF